MPDSTPAPPEPAYPLLYQVNTRVWMTELSAALGRPATLDDIPEDKLEAFAREGFDWIWFLSVWTTGPAGRRVSREDPELRREFEATLPDLREDDIAGSGFAIASYSVSPSLGGDEALARLRQRLRSHGLRLMLDFVPNHTALDHEWVATHPEYYVAGSELERLQAPHNYTWVKRNGDEILLAHGRDPYFPGWPDTLQLDYSRPETQEAMAQELLSIADRCDGVRCDMAMLVLPEVFERTWGRPAHPFWPSVTDRVRRRSPGFVFMAEVYWDLEWTMIQQGFDYAYDKRLYDRLREGHGRSVRDHLTADLEYQRHLARFLENHDEPRAAAVFGPEMHEAAAIVTYLTPGLRFLHQGQFEGRTKRISPHLVRAPSEPVDERLSRFYAALIGVLRRPELCDGEWRLADHGPAGDETWQGFICGSWQGADGARLLVAVNYSPDRGRCFVNLPFDALAGRTIRLRDLMSDATYDRDGDDLVARGLYLDMPGWGRHVFEVVPAV